MSDDNVVSIDEARINKVRAEAIKMIKESQLRSIHNPPENLTVIIGLQLRGPRLRPTAPTDIEVLDGITKTLEVLYNLFDCIKLFFNRVDIYNSADKANVIIGDIDAILLATVRLPLPHLVLTSDARVKMIKLIYIAILDELKLLLDMLDNGELISLIYNIINLYLACIKNLTRLANLYDILPARKSTLAKGHVVFAEELGNGLLIDEEMGVWINDTLKEFRSVIELANKIALL